MASATALIAAARCGERLGAGGPKALVAVAGRPLIAWSLDAFAASAAVGRVIVAAPPGADDEIAGLAPDGLDLRITAGGPSRAESVASGLALCESELVAVHDAARPLVTPALIDALVERLAAEPDAAGVIAATPVTDTIKRIEGAGRRIADTPPREELWAAQTPQVFRTEVLREAHADAGAEGPNATDDAALVEAAGGTVLVEPTATENLKVTTAADLRAAERLLAEHAPNAIRRAMPHVRGADIEATRAFYVGFLGFEVGMDEPGFLMMRSPSEPTTQVLATTPERDAADPDTAQIAISIEVGDVDAVHERARELGLPIVYPLTDEPWGVRRFFVADPDGTILNINSHIDR